MPAISDQAIVLRLSDYSETSQIVTLFSAGNGQLRLIAKGARRSTRARVAAGLDLLEYGEAGFFPPRGEAGLGTLTEWVQRDAFLGLRSSLPALYAGLYAAERVTALTQELDPHPALFVSLRELLRNLCALPAASGSAGTSPTAPGRAGLPPADRTAGGSTSREAAAAHVGREIVRFQLALLEATGLSPELEVCVSCGRRPALRAGVYFSSAAGGLVCRDCEAHHPQRRRVPAEWLAPGALQTRPHAWFELLDEHLTYHAGSPARSAACLRAVLAAS